jgi:hypothetical protein
MHRIRRDQPRLRHAATAGLLGAVTGLAVGIASAKRVRRGLDKVTRWDPQLAEYVYEGLMTRETRKHGPDCPGALECG